MAHARLTVLPRGTHAANMERAEDFNEAVLGFLAEHGDGRWRPSA